MNGQMIKTKFDLIRALNNSERVQIQYAKENACAVIFSPTAESRELNEKSSYATLKFNGYLKVDSVVNTKLIQKTEWRLYLVQGLGFENRLDSISDIKDEDAKNSSYYKKECEKLPRWKKFSSKHLLGESLDNLLRNAKRNFLLEMQDNLKKQLEYEVDMPYSWSGKNFNINNVADKDAFQSKLFYPTDEVIVLYQ